MYELMILACLASQPTQCEEFQLPFEAPMDFITCLREGQLRLAQWSETRPEWTIKRWRCELPKT